MKVSVFFLLFGSFLFCYSDDGVQKVAAIENELTKYIRESLNTYRSKYIGTGRYKFWVSLNGFLGRTKHALVWKGFYSNDKKYVNHPVAIKIFHDSATMNEELMVFKQLNAVHNSKIENIGIPSVYWHGSFLSYEAIATTLFEGSVNDRYEEERKAGRKFTDTTILSIFLHAVKGLKYLNGYGIVHNDIQPKNMFLRDNEVFVGDFEKATLGGGQTRGYSSRFASKNFYLDEPLSPMDDLESLVYSMWYISDVPMVRETDTNITEGKLLSQGNKKQAIARMMAKCSHYTNQKVQDVFKYISIDQVLSGKPNPDYNKIIMKLNSTLDALNKGPIRFEWLTGGK